MKIRSMKPWSVWFSAFSLAAVVIYMYVFNLTMGSLILVTLMHTSQNAWSNLLFDREMSYEAKLCYKHGFDCATVGNIPWTECLHR